MIFEYIKAIIYGIVEGVTEWLPISSTGHLILLERIIPLDIGVCDLELTRQYAAMFDVVVQLGAVLAVLCLYFKRLNPFGKEKKDARRLWLRLILCTLPAAVIGLAADTLCNRFFGCELDALLFKPRVVACALIVYGMLFILVERLSLNESKPSSSVPPSIRSTLAIGVFQALAIIPGTSRSGATILGARILGIPRSAAAEFSFFAAIPVIAAASLLKGVEFIEYARNGAFVIPAEALLVLAIAGIVAFAVSMLTIKFLTDFVKKHSFIPFGIYRILLGIAVLFFVN